MLSSLLLGSALVAFCTGVAASSDADLVVHEWGTFTSFQSEEGATIAGINVDDEPVPAFVHRLQELPIFTTASLPARWSQGAPRCHSGVTLRLETPVLYFYPQPEFGLKQPLDVRVRFNGGWLTEFYPAATAAMPGFPDRLGRETKGDLEWTGLRLQSAPESQLPRTQERVWLAPRAVQSSIVSTVSEAEKYVFYRGVGHLDAPLVTKLSRADLQITLSDSAITEMPMSWLVRVSSDGKVSYRTIRGGKQSFSVPLPTTSAGNTSQIGDLRKEMSSALTSVGLYPDEAQAMLETWRLSYFDSEGLRLFFLLPQSWTDHQLPLSISAPANVTRVMVGRIELVSDTQRAALERLYSLPEEALQIPPLYVDREPDPVNQTLEQVNKRQNTVLGEMRSGKPHAQLYRSIGREVPEALSLYDSLGRFRDALLAHRWRTEPDAGRRTRIKQIIDTFSSCTPGS